MQSSKVHRAINWRKRNPVQSGSGSLHYGDLTIQQRNHLAAEWRLRVGRRNAVSERLREEFPNGLGLITQGSLLQVLSPELTVENLPTESRYRGVILESDLPRSISARALKLLMKMDKPSYQRLEDAYAAFGVGVLLAAGPEADMELTISMNKLKLWCIEHGTRNVDQVTTYLKWLIKVAQSVALNCTPEAGQSYFPGWDSKRNRILRTPYKGCLSFIDEVITGLRPRQAGLRVEEHRAIAQIANASRALPFPSRSQVTKSVLETLDLITEVPPPLSKEERELYIGGLAYMGGRLGPFTGVRTHSSLTNSGSWERSQSEGGRAQEIVSHARPVADTPVTIELLDRLKDRLDCFGEPVLPPATAELVKRFILEGKEVNRSITLGDILYVPAHEAHAIMERSQTGYVVPKYLGNIIAMVSSAMMTRYGSYDREASYQDEDRILIFDRGVNVKFTLFTDSIPVKAALSEEGGMKTRLVTAAPAAVTQLGQLMRHTIAADLSRDPFLRVGFEEADKLWETLKAYRALRPAKSPVNSDLHFISLDLKEATYRMPHEVLEMNHRFMSRRYADNPVWKVFSNMYGTFKRTVDLSDIRKKGYDDGLYPDDPTSTCGSFMGDSLSFMHLTIMVSSCVWQASAAAHFGSVLKRPDLRYFNGWVSRPLGQTVGDDAIILGATTLFADEFDKRLNGVNARMSKIHSRSYDSGTFCENWFCIPSDDGDEKRAQYPQDSLFGEIWFLDTIKGSLLSGHAKVKADGADPFIGQARMLSKQIQWHPVEWMRTHVPTVMWARNFMSARFLGNVNAHLPISLGGLEIALGKMRTIQDPEMARYAPYLEAMLDLPIEEFLKWQMLLTGISRSNPKGVPWANDELKIAFVVSRVRTFAESNVLQDIPTQVLVKGRGEVQRFMEETLNLTSVRFLTDLMTRLEAFEAFWKGEAASQPFLTISSRKLRPRFKTVWSKIREKITPKDVITSKSWQELGKKFDQRTWGLLFNKDDPCLLDVYEGMSTLGVQWGRLGALASA